MKKDRFLTLDASTAMEKLRVHANPPRAKILQGFFRTGPGEYAEGDLFLGMTVPQVRKVGREFRELPLSELKILLESPHHEDRLLALVILVERFRRATESVRGQIFDFYLRHLDRVNNWDLVDVSAPTIVGVHLLEKPRKMLLELAKSPSLWRRRVAIVATQGLIREKDLDETFRLARVLIKDPHDLIHKAVGWMLREAGNRDKARLRKFLGREAPRMPRTMLRYAIEKFPERERQRFLRMRL